MPNQLTGEGLEVSTYEELLEYYTGQYETIYGEDINLASDTPDGQMMNIQIQAILDLQDLLVAIYNAFDPDNAVGNVLDQRVAINGIQRQAGTFTVTNITLVNDRSINLVGLDDDEDNPYTISDNAGNRWFLTESETGLSAGTHVLVFRAENPGAQLTTPNTITTPVTIVLGVTSVNNPTTYTTLGINEETDAVLKVRRQRSVSLASQGYLSGLLAALENINGITSAFVYENDTDATDSDGVPSHSIWVIVAGTAADEDIANAIYQKRNAGCGMKGDETYTITQVNGTPFVVRWDTVITRNLFIKFTTTSLDGVVPVNIQAIREGIAEQFVPGVFEEVNINALATLVQQIDSNCLVTDAGFSLGTEQTLSLSGIPAAGNFKILYNGVESTTIQWDDTTPAVEAIIQAVPGLSNTQVSGSLAAQELIFDLSGESDVAGLLTVVTNSLTTVAPAAITFSYDADYAPTLEPPTKQNQFTVAEENIIITPMQLTPTSSEAEASSGEVQFTGYGGYGDYTYSIDTNNSGGTINASTGLYEAGAVSSVVDIVKVTDRMGNTATATVSVV